MIIFIFIIMIMIMIVIIMIMIMTIILMIMIMIIIIIIKVTRQAKQEAKIFITVTITYRAKATSSQGVKASQYPVLLDGAREPDYHHQDYHVQLCDHENDMIFMVPSTVGRVIIIVRNIILIMIIRQASAMF